VIIINPGIMKTFFLTFFLLSSLFVSQTHGQYYIGKTVDEIKTMMQESGSDFYFAKQVNTGKHHFLKYENVDQTKTKLFIMGDDGKCRYTKLMCDYALLKQIQDSLNSNYQYQKDLTWRDYNEGGEYEYIIEMNKRDWFFTIRTSRLKK